MVGIRAEKRVLIMPYHFVFEDLAS